jgi:hypothetical protein
MQQTRRILSVIILLLAGCGGVNEQEISDAFQRYGENFSLRLQKRYFDPATSPVDLTIKIAPKPEYVFQKPAAPGEPYRGQLKLRQTERSPAGETDRLVVYRFVRGPAGWRLDGATGQILEKRRVSRGKGLTEVGDGEQTDLLKDDIFAPHLQAAIAATPPEN